MNVEQITEMLKDLAPDVVLLPEFNDALIGIANDFKNDFRPAYSMEKVIQILKLNPADSKTLVDTFKKKLKAIPIKRTPVFITLLPIEVDMSKEILEKFYKGTLPE